MIFPAVPPSSSYAGTFADTPHQTLTNIVTVRLFTIAAGIKVYTNIISACMNFLGIGGSNDEG
jgi:hypothetical protein